MSRFPEPHLVLDLLVWCRDLLGVPRKQSVPLTFSICSPWGPALQQSHPSLAGTEAPVFLTCLQGSGVQQ